MNSEQSQRVIRSNSQDVSALIAQRDSRELAFEEEEDQQEGKNKCKLYFKKAVVRPVLNQLRLGITPTKLALSISLGVICGLFPIPGTTALLCILAALVFKLNQVIINVINLILTPINVLMIPVFYKLGHELVNSTSQAISAKEFLSQIRHDFFRAIGTFKSFVLEAIVGWVLMIPFSFVVLFAISYYSLQSTWPSIQRLIGNDDYEDNTSQSYLIQDRTLPMNEFTSVYSSEDDIGLTGDDENSSTFFDRQPVTNNINNVYHSMPPSNSQNLKHNHFSRRDPEDNSISFVPQKDRSFFNEL